MTNPNKPTPAANDGAYGQSESQPVKPSVDDDAAVREKRLQEMFMQPVFLDADDPTAALPTSVTVVTARELFGMRPGETVAQAAARKAAEELQ